MRSTLPPLQTKKISLTASSSDAASPAGSPNEKERPASGGYKVASATGGNPTTPKAPSNAQPNPSSPTRSQSPLGGTTSGVATVVDEKTKPSSVPVLLVENSAGLKMFATPAAEAGGSEGVLKAKIIVDSKLENKELVVSSGVDQWIALYFQEAIKAINAADEFMLNFFIGPNLLSLDDPRDTYDLFVKFNTNEESLINAFYRNAEKIIAAFREILELNVQLSFYRNKFLPVDEESIKSFDDEMARKKQKERELQIENQKAGIAAIVSAQFQPDALQKEPENIIKAKECIAKFKAADSNFRGLFAVFCDDDKQILNFAESGYNAVKLALKDPIINIDRHRNLFHSLIQKVKVLDPEKAANFLENILIKGNEILCDQLIANMAPEIQKMRLRKQLTEQGIKDSFVNPLRQTYQKKLAEFLKEFKKELESFRNSGINEKLGQMLTSLGLCKARAKDALKVQMREFPTIKQLPPEPSQKTRAQIEEEYKFQAEQKWLKNKGPLFIATDKDIKPILATQIGFTTFDIVADKEGNTLMHHLLFRYQQLKNLSNADYPDKAVKMASLMSMFTTLILRGASVYVRNKNQQTAFQYAKTGALSPAESKAAQVTKNRDLTAEKEKTFHELLNWSSMIPVIDSIECCTPPASLVKDAVVTYSKDNEAKIANWRFYHSILYNYEIVAVIRLNEVAMMGQMLYVAQNDPSDTMLRDGIKALADNAPRGWLGGSALYGTLGEILRKNERMFVSVSYDQIVRNREGEKLEKERERQKLEDEKVKRKQAQDLAEVKADLKAVKEQQEKEKAKQEQDRAEQERVKAEQEQVKAEQERVKAEQEQIKAEQERIKAGQERIKAEQEQDKADRAQEKIERERDREERARDRAEREAKKKLKAKSSAFFKPEDDKFDKNGGSGDTPDNKGNPPVPSSVSGAAAPK